MNGITTVGERISYLCSKKGLTISDLANIAGVHLSTVRSIINEKTKEPHIITIKKLCDGLDISLIEFFDDDVFRSLDQEIK